MPTYLSQKGLEDLEKELADRKAERPVIAEKIGDAKELGDLSENFEYHAAKEEQGLNETRIYQLEDMIKDAVIVEQKSGSSNISLGCTFVVKTNGTEKTFEMVGSTEANPLEGKISNESPLGNAFLGKEKGDKVDIEVPSGTVTYEILEIK